MVQWIPSPRGWQSPSSVGAMSTPTWVDVPGVPEARMLAGTVLPPGATDFLADLREVMPAELNLDVNSGTRTASEQAAAMWRKLAIGGPEELIRIYKSRRPQITKLLTLPERDWADQIQTWADQGIYMSRHMRGGSLDLSVRYPDRQLWPRDLRDQFIAAVTSLTDRDPLLETAPYHLHVDLPAEPVDTSDPGLPSAVDTSEPVGDIAEEDLVFAPAAQDIVFDPMPVVKGGLGILFLGALGYLFWTLKGNGSE